MDTRIKAAHDCSTRAVLKSLGSEKSRKPVAPHDDIPSVGTHDTVATASAAGTSSFLNPGDPAATRMALLSQQGQFA
jgi:hypothetical protein